MASRGELDDDNPITRPKNTVDADIEPDSPPPFRPTQSVVSIHDDCTTIAAPNRLSSSAYAAYRRPRTVHPAIQSTENMIPYNYNVFGPPQLPHAATSGSSSSSSESHGSSSFHYGGNGNVGFTPHGLPPAPPPPHAAVHPYYGPPPPIPQMVVPPQPGYQFYHWTVSEPIEYIEHINPEDVLSGRGGATNSHSGNRAFRRLVKSHQDRYLQAKKRDKPSVATEIVDLVRQKGGRFLRRCDSTGPQGQVLWVDIGDDRAREKTCQALREGAPELRKRRQQSMSSDEDDPRILQHNDTMDSSTRSSYSSEQYPHSTKGPSSMSGANGLFFQERNNNTSIESRRRGYVAPFLRQQEDARILRTVDYRDDNDEVGRGHLIQPSNKLMKRSGFLDIPLEQLSEQERNLYREFVPPRPLV